MTENNLNRFTYGSNERWEDVLIDNLEKKEYDLYSIDSLCNRLWEQTQRFEKENQRLNTEIEQLKSELQKIYEIATINKVRDIVDEVYDDLLYETSDESDYARKKVLKCLEMIDDYKDVIENV